MGSKPMSFLTSHHTCPKKRGKTPHKGGCVIGGSGDVFVGSMPVTTVGHKLVCDGPADTIAEGSPSVFVNGKPVARVGSMTVHGGKLVEGNPTVMVGDAGYVGTASGMQCLTDLTEVEKLAIEEEQNPEPTDSRPPPYQSPTGPGAKKGASKPGQGAPVERIEEEEEEQEVPFEEWLHVEVLGENHPEGHSLKVMTREYGDIDAAVDGTHAEEKTDDSVIHKWLLKKDSEDYAAKVAVAMEIDTEEGDPIRLPVFDKPYAEPKKEPRQRYILAPFVPLTTIERQGTARKGVVTSRAGYLYIFRHDMLWREIQLVKDDNGELTYRDVPVDNYRDAPGDRLSKDRREPTGVPLEEIWLPVKYLYSSLAFQQTRYRVAFSEVQWSAGRIYYLEHNVRDQEERAQVPVEYLTNWSRYLAKLVPLSAQEEVPPQRAREPLLEEQVPCAYEFLIDRSGSYTKECYELARAEQQALLNGGKQAEQSWKQSQHEGTELWDSAGFRWAAFQDLWKEEKGHFDYAQSYQKVWNNIEAATDVLNVPRRRKIYGLVVYDEIHELRLQVARVNQAMEYQADVKEWLNHQEHFQSAELIEQTILPVNLGGKRNPLREHIKMVDLKPTGKLRQTLRQPLRAMAVNCTKENQVALYRFAKEEYVQSRLADLFSLEGDDYLSGFMFVEGVFGKLQYDAEAADRPWLAKTNPDCDSRCEAILTSVDHNPHRAGSKLVLDVIEEGSSYPLHTMMFPSEEEVPLDQKYDPAMVIEQDNPGDGRFRPSLFAEIGGKEKFSDPSDLQTMEAKMLAELEDPESPTMPTVRLVVKTLDGIASKLMSELKKAHERLAYDAVKYDLNLHGPLVRTLKAMNPTLLGEVVVMPYGEQPQNMVPLGIEDPEIGLKNGLTEAERNYVNTLNENGRFEGQLRAGDGGLTAHTDPNRLAGDAGSADSGRYYLYMAPASSELIAKYRDAREKLSRSKSIGKALDAAGLPFVVAGLELWNVCSFMDRYDRTNRTRSKVRVAGEFVSVYSHLTFAILTICERVAGEESWIARSLNKTVLDVKNLVDTGKLSKKIGAMLPAAISVRMVSVSLLGAIDAGIRISDTLDYWEKNQLAASTAMGVSTVGSLLSTWAGLALMKAASGTGAAVIFGLSTPVAWVVLGVGFTIALGGAILASALEKNELELWLDNGPFGDNRTSKFDHIWGEEAELEAFYRLANLLAGVKVTAERFTVDYELAVSMAVDLVQIRGGTNFDLAISHIAEELATVDTRIRVQSNLAALVGRDAFDIHFRLQRRWANDGFLRGRGVERTEYQESTDGQWWIHQVSLPDGFEYWLHTPEHSPEHLVKPKNLDERFEWAVRARFTMTLSIDRDYACIERDYVFPAPELVDPVEYDKDKHGTPDFHEEQVFWAGLLTNQGDLDNPPDDVAGRLSDKDVFYV